jgi:hypothetical protein
MSILEEIEGKLNAVFAEVRGIAHKDAQAVISLFSQHLAEGATRAEDEAKAAIAAHAATVGAAIDARAKIAAEAAAATVEPAAS